MMMFPFFEAFKMQCQFKCISIWAFSLTKLFTSVKCNNQGRVEQHATKEKHKSYASMNIMSSNSILGRREIHWFYSLRLHIVFTPYSSFVNMILNVTFKENIIQLHYYSKYVYLGKDYQLNKLDCQTYFLKGWSNCRNADYFGFYIH